MTAAAEIRTLAVGIGLAAAPLLRRRLPPERRAEIVRLLNELNRLAAATGADTTSPEREVERALARYTLETYANLTVDRALLTLLEELLKLHDLGGVQWPDIVGAVNRMSDHRHVTAAETRGLTPAELLARVEHAARHIAAKFYPTEAS